MPRVVVVGAGPAGCSAALTLASRGVEALLVERRTLPRPKTCAGGLSPWALAWLRGRGLAPPIEAEAYPIRAARLWTGRAGPMLLRGRLQAAVLPRQRLDQLLAQAACAAGATLREGVTARGLVHDGRRLVGVETDAGLIEADAAVVASGAGGRLTPREVSETERFFGIMTRYEGLGGVEPETLEIFVTPAPGIQYGWIFPESDERANVGICFRRTPKGPNARELLDSFLDLHLARRLATARPAGRVQAHPIRAQVWPSRLVDDGVIYAGEAAGLVDPLTGEGIYLALRSGELAGRSLADRLRRNLPATRVALTPYAAAVALRLSPRLAASAAALAVIRSPAAHLLRPLTSERVRALLEGLYSRA